MKNIEWKKSNINYDKLNSIDHKSMIASENLKNNVLNNSEIQSKNGIKGGMSSMNKLKDNGTLFEHQSKAAKIANSKPERIAKFKSLKTKKHQSNAAKIANNKLIICPDGYITTATSSTKYCKLRNLDYTKCIQFNGSHLDIINKVCNELNHEFTAMQFINVCKSLNYYINIFDYAKKEMIIECIHIGTKGSNKDVTIYKKK